MESRIYDGTFEGDYGETIQRMRVEKGSESVPFMLDSHIKDG